MLPTSAQPTSASVSASATDARAPAELPPRAGVVAVVGRANVGKSSLINRLVGEKISIATPVAQTTRNLIRGVVNDPRGQLVLLDTPGLHRAESHLGQAINRVARGAVTGVDAVLLVLDGARKPRDTDAGWMRRLLFVRQPCLFALNKADLPDFDPAPYRECLRAAEAAKERSRAFPWLSVSAATGDGLDALVEALFEAVPPGEPFFPADTVTDYPRKLAIADVIREKCFGWLREELPHALGVCVDDIREAGDHWRVAVSLYVQRESQKPIVIGPKGRMLRRIRRQAEPELSAMFEVKVTLDMRVKAEKHWDRNYWILQRMGIEG